jgi:hypothetical protein
MRMHYKMERLGKEAVVVIHHSTFVPQGNKHLNIK